VRRERRYAQLAIPFEHKRLYKWQPPFYVQPKLDGVRCRALIDDMPTDTEELSSLYSSTNKLIRSVPHINEQLNALSESVPNIEEFDGELYIHGKSFEHITSITSRTVNMHHDFRSIEYHIFDVIPTSGVSTPQHVRFVHLAEVKDEVTKYPIQIKVVPTYLAEDMDEIAIILDTMLANGYEGVIIRSKDAPYERKRSYSMMKLKPRKEDEYTITGSLEEISIHGDPKDALGAFICKGDSHHTFKVGTGPLLTREHRIELWKHRRRLVGKRVKVKYQDLTKDKKVPRFPVAVEIIP